MSESAKLHQHGCNEKISFHLEWLGYIETSKTLTIYKKKKPNKETENKC